MADVVSTIRQKNEGSIEQAADYLGVPVEQVEAAARYYADYRDEVDSLIERARVAGERERRRARLQREALPIATARFTDDVSLPRNKVSIPPWIKTLSDLLESNPTDDTLRNRVCHLP